MNLLCCGISRKKKVLTPKRQNDVYIYEHPSEQPDYDVPQSHYAQENGIQETKPLAENNDAPSFRGQDSIISGAGVSVHTRQGSIGSASDMKVAPQDMYDTLPSRTRPVKKPSMDTGEEDYDQPVPMNERIKHFQDKYESPKSLLVNNDQGCNSNRSSALSTLSNLSGHSGSSSASNRSFQADNSQGGESTYDVPRKPVEVVRSPIRQNAVDLDSNSLKRKQILDKSNNGTLSKNSSIVSEDIYDTPPPNPQPVNDIYNVPPKPRAIDDKLAVTKIRDGKSSADQSRTSGDSGIETGKVDIPPKLGYHNPSDQEGYYDHPRNNKSILLRPNKEKGTVYDIPPHVTRDDSIHSFKHSASDRLSMDTFDTRSSICSSSDTGSDVPVITFDELPLNLDAANDLFVKLQQNLQRDTNQLLSFVSSKWLNRSSVEIHLLDIKQACFALRDSLKEFVEFGQGALANSAKTDDKKLVKKIHKHLEPLQNGANNIGECCENITKAGWLVSNLSNDNGTTSNIENINVIVNEAKDVLENARPLIAYIRGNAKILFRKQGAEENVIMHGISSNQCITSTPVKPNEPPMLKPKMKLLDGSLDGSIQERPLPIPPMAKRPLPSTPSLVSNSSMSLDKSVRNDSSLNVSASTNNMEPMYDTPKGSMHSILDNENDYDNADEICSYEDDDGDYANDSKEWTTMPEKGRPRNGLPPRAKSADIFLEGDSDPKPDLSRFSYHESQIGDSYNMDFSIPAPNSTNDLSNSTTGLSSRFLEKLGKIQNDSTKPLTKHHSFTSGSVQPRIPKIHQSDKQMLSFYCTQLETQTTQLTQAIDAFMQTMEYQQPPKVFIVHSKMVILVAHKFVYIGDTLTRNLMSEEFRTKLTFYGNKLCDSLKLSVTATKKAALQHPDKFALQEMVDRMADISYAAKDLKSEIGRAAEAQVI